MATRTPTITSPVPGIKVVTWTGLLNGDDGLPVDYTEFADMTAHFGGTFGTGGEIVIEGSNNIAALGYVTLTDPQGNPIEYVAAGIEIVAERPLFVRPRVPAGDGTTDLTAVLVMRRAR